TWLVSPLSNCRAWGRISITASSDSTAPFGLPGTFRITECPRTPHIPRLSAEKGVFFEPSSRMRSATPSTIRSQMARVASGVTSRFIQQTQALHQQTLRIESSALFCSLGFEIYLEIAPRPAQNFKHCLVTAQFTIGRMHDLAFSKIHLAAVWVVLESQ